MGQCMTGVTATRNVMSIAAPICSKPNDIARPPGVGGWVEVHDAGWLLWLRRDARASLPMHRRVRAHCLTEELERA